MEMIAAGCASQSNIALWGNIWVAEHKFIHDFPFKSYSSAATDMFMVVKPSMIMDFSNPTFISRLVSSKPKRY